jgi:hypothetical protein
MTGLRVESTNLISPKISCHAVYIFLLVPVTLFVISLFIRPQMTFDSTYGFLALRSMLDGGSFNYVTSPDPGNIANNIETFLTWWSPGQYLVPGAFIWLGASYGLAISLTTLIATVIGVLGWAQIARSFDASCFVLFLFLLGLVTFTYTTVHFSIFNGGDVVLFAVMPWSLFALQLAAQKPPAISIAISVLSAALLFIAKLSGIIVFAATVAGISFVDVWKQRRLTSPLLAMWAGSAVAALLFLAFWVTRGATPAGATSYTFTWPAVFFPVAAAAFSGLSAIDFSDDLYHLTWLHTSAPILSDTIVNKYASYVLGPLGLLLMGWIWFRLRDTRYRSITIRLFSITAFYIAAYVAIYVRNGTIVSFEERYFYYAGIPFFLLLLVALDQRRGALARAIPILIVGVFAVYGVTSYAHEAMRSRHNDRASGTAMLVVPPGVLEYLRSEMAVHNWANAIAVVPSPEAAVSLPHFRILFSWELLDSTPLADIARQRWSGRTDKIFVILNENALRDGKAEAVLRAFVDYDVAKWNQITMDGAVVYTQ